MGRYRARRLFTEEPPLVFTLGLLSIRRTADSENQTVVLVQLTAGWERLEEDVAAFNLS